MEIKFEKVIRGGRKSTRDLMSEPSENLDRQLDKPHRQIGDPREAHATGTQATQHRSAIRNTKTKTYLKSHLQTKKEKRKVREKQTR